LIIVYFNDNIIKILKRREFCMTENDKFTQEDVEAGICTQKECDDSQIVSDNPERLGEVVKDHGDELQGS
jgi:hypothetical protein